MIFITAHASIFHIQLKWIFITFVKRLVCFTYAVKGLDTSHMCIGQVSRSININIGYVMDTNTLSKLNYWCFIVPYQTITSFGNIDKYSLTSSCVNAGTYPKYFIVAGS